MLNDWKNGTSAISGRAPSIAASSTDTSALGERATTLETQRGVLALQLNRMPVQLTRSVGWKAELVFEVTFRASPLMATWNGPAQVLNGEPAKLPLTSC